MTLTPGTRLGSYEILAAIGSGGMGEVYRARDTKPGRTVAIKVILDQFASDEERVGRFQREAKQRLIGIVSSGQRQGDALTQINVVLNWHEELKQLVPLEK